MAIQIYNTLTRKKEIFTPLGKKVNMFVCGPTVYDFIHLGNAKSFVQFDVIARYLRYKGYDVMYIQNITDIDDKIIKKAEEKKGENPHITWKEISQTYSRAFLEDMEKLGITSVSKYASATNYIPEIISQVKRLIAKGIAYKTNDGYYFDLSKCVEYGKLANRTALEAEDAISRIDENTEKRNKGDFCLWKFKKENEPFWPSDIGDGRPGWHIEDTAITEKELGVQYDIHGGGIDLIFPHHEAEIAQMESISGKKPFVNYWMHAGFLKVNNERMGKSKGNFFTVRDILAKGYHPLSIRYLVLSTHYKQELNFTFESLLSAENIIEKIKNFSDLLKDAVQQKDSIQQKDLIPQKDTVLDVTQNFSANTTIVEKIISTAREGFTLSLDDDFNMSPALAAFFEFMREINTLQAEKKLNSLDAKACLHFVEEIDSVLGIVIHDETVLPLDVTQLVKERDTVRMQKNWAESDRLRILIKSRGYDVLDSSEGTKIKKTWSFKKNI